MQTMTLNTTVSIPKEDGKLVLAESEIIKLRSNKLLSMQAYFYLAILCSYGEGVEKIDKEWFCKRWGISQDEFALTLAQLQKKGFLKSESERFVQLELILEDA